MINPIYIKNIIFRTNAYLPPHIPISQELPLLTRLRQSKFVKEQDLGDNISSFNFTREAFLKRKWDEQTVKARGLFLNNLTGEIVARSYNKFFNLGERKETELFTLKNTLKFPVNVWVKENGYLGLISKLDTGVLFVTSKSTNQGSHADWFKNILGNLSLEQLDRIEYFCDQLNCTLVCEVIDPINDPHIIKYNKKGFYILDAVKNTEEFNLIPNSAIEQAFLEFPSKTLAYVLNDFSELIQLLDSVEDLEYTYNDDPVEGFVLEDQNKMMVKVKTRYYNMWKHFRAISQAMSKGHTINTARFTEPLQNQFYAFLRTKDREYLSSKSIIELREEYYAQVQ